MDVIWARRDFKDDIQNIDIKGGRIMAHQITNECVACGACEFECQAEAIQEGAEKYHIDSKKCTDCTACARICPMNAVTGSR